MIPSRESSECCKRITYFNIQHFGNLGLYLYQENSGVTTERTTQVGLLRLNNQLIFNDQSVDNTGRLCLSILPSSSHKFESHCSLTKYKKRNTVFSMFVIKVVS